MDVQGFLLSNKFRIPHYQRDFAWTENQMQDLFDDIQEAMDTGSTHYIGTFVLAGEDREYEIVDGQQRLSALTMIVHALLSELDPQDPDRIVNEAVLLYQSQENRDFKLNFGVNATFMKALLAGQDPKPESAGQRRLKRCYLFARERAKSLAEQGGKGLIKQWLDAIKKLELIYFVEKDIGRAIRMFQTVNDRGLPLTTMDKAKALLVFYSNRNLGGVLDGKINDCFRDCFVTFDTVRELVQEPGYRIDNIARENFSEDDILRYHYLAYWHPEAENIDDYNGYTHTVFEGFLKKTLKKLASDPDKLRSFIDDYISDLRQFAIAFRELITETKTNESLYKVFVVLGLSARLYPLAIRLYQRNLLFEKVPGTNVDLLHCLEVCDVRVYKTRGTDPAKDIGILSHRSRWAEICEIANGLRNFVTQFMPDGLFKTRLGEDMYNNPATPLLLLAYDEDVAGRPYSLSELVDLVKSQLTREHIIAQTPTCSITSYGFASEEEYRIHSNMLGNLTLLTKSENSKCQNKPVHTKLTDPGLYASSVFAATRKLAHQYSSGDFKKTDLIVRTGQLTDFVMAKYPIWDECRPFSGFPTSACRTKNSFCTGAKRPWFNLP
ncbi:MAG: DUF262 domain-containing HNH endonuclease family protein [Thermanaeromonas sp.]|uniref:DUF262 domain-containing protein n=1 Tax=Thermanaeromonas sp. TaxID=2003697 RepID=UPI00243B7923|nr:DUF262 domain-containing HNH endonuclease family protein [Thermanaeromonas sp.]MCG0278803.1 DUF262 domain-containing HNH endonuclease family protein [Thermanaeromonas sp.]